MKKTKLNEKDIERLAKLANLKLTSSEIKNYSEQLSSILDYVDQLNRVDTDKTDSTSSSSGLTNSLRDDKSSSKQNSVTLESLAVTEKAGKKYFKVKRIM